MRKAHVEKLKVIFLEWFEEVLVAQHLFSQYAQYFTNATFYVCMLKNKKF